MPLLNGFASGFGTGEKAVGAAVVQLPATRAKSVSVKARSTNTGLIYVGKAGVTVADGTDDATTGFALGAGEEAPPLPVNKLSDVYLIASAAAQGVTYVYTF